MPKTIPNPSSFSVLFWVSSSAATRKTCVMMSCVYHWKPDFGEYWYTSMVYTGFLAFLRKNTIPSPSPKKISSGALYHLIVLNAKKNQPHPTSLHKYSPLGRMDPPSTHPAAWSNSFGNRMDFCAFSARPWSSFEENIAPPVVRSFVWLCYGWYQIDKIRIRNISP